MAHYFTPTFVAYNGVPALVIRMYESVPSRVGDTVDVLHDLYVFDEHPYFVRAVRGTELFGNVPDEQTENEGGKE